MRALPSNSRCRKKNEIFRWNMIITLPCHPHYAKMGTKKNAASERTESLKKIFALFVYDANRALYIMRMELMSHIVGIDAYVMAMREIESISWLLFFVVTLSSWFQLKKKNQTRVNFSCCVFGWKRKFYWFWLLIFNEPWEIYRKTLSCLYAQNNLGKFTECLNVLPYTSKILE